MDISSTNDPLIKKSNKKKKKNSKQEFSLAAPTEVLPPHVSTDMLIDISEHASNFLEEFLPEDNSIIQFFSVPSKIMNITFNEIINELINMIVDQLDSTYLSDPLSNIPMDQLSTQYLTPLSFTGVLDKSHSFILSNSTSTIVDSSLRPLFFNTPEETSSNRSQHALSLPLEYTYNGFLIVDDIKQDSSINNHEELLAFTELFIQKFEHFSSINYCSTKSVSSIIVKFSKHEGLIKAVNYFKNGNHNGRMKLISKTYYRMEGNSFSSSDHNFFLPTTSRGHILNLDINNNNFHLQDSTLYLILQPQSTENDTHNNIVDSFVRSQKDMFLQQLASTSHHSNHSKTMDVTHHKQLSFLKLLYNNVNRLRNYNLKLTYLIDYAALYHFLIIGATKTNIDQNAGRFINIHQDYTVYFSEHDAKNKGSGVAIII
ncbi:hypothetical protein C1645_814057 [Glomus cerebriforme]|uniref:Uncharacterized protein n=1 Tax=Glomus cerebriforme TaxID=658196 RepID=A0A397THT8_9GLOM|nr:hypothetical protein C1645_814057 [Glomus cerebriforme]